MSVHRYSPDSIEFLCQRTRQHHLAVLGVFAILFCAGVLTFVPLGEALIDDTVVVAVLGGIWVASRNRSRERILKLIRSSEVEIDDKKISWRSNFTSRVIYRSQVVAARLSKKGIWLHGDSRRRRLYIPPEIEDFETLSGLVAEWLPPQVTRETADPSGAGTYFKVYGLSAGVVILLFVALASNNPTVGMPACILSAAGIAWYFAWSGKRSEERMWKVLLPASGYLAAATLLLRAWTLFTR